MGKNNLLKMLKARAAALQREIYALTLAARDRRVPWYSKAFLGLVAAYALSPIDLIPDFIPVLGYLDDLVIVPLGVALALKMIPAQVMDEARQQADKKLQMSSSASRVGAAIVISIWLVALAVVVRAILAWLKK